MLPRFSGAHKLPVEAFREVAVEDLPTLAERLRSIQHQPSRQIGGNWHDWGNFRAIVHEAVYERLTES